MNGWKQLLNRRNVPIKFFFLTIPAVLSRSFQNIGESRPLGIVLGWFYDGVLFPNCLLYAQNMDAVALRWTQGLSSCTVWVQSLSRVFCGYTDCYFIAFAGWILFNFGKKSLGGFLLQRGMGFWGFFDFSFPFPHLEGFTSKSFWQVFFCLLVFPLQPGEPVWRLQLFQTLERLSQQKKGH